MESPIAKLPLGRQHRKRGMRKQSLSLPRPDSPKAVEKAMMLCCGMATQLLIANGVLLHDMAALRLQSGCLVLVLVLTGTGSG